MASNLVAGWIISNDVAQSAAVLAQNKAGLGNITALKYKRTRPAWLDRPK